MRPFPMTTRRWLLVVVIFMLTVYGYIVFDRTRTLLAHARVCQNEARNIAWTQELYGRLIRESEEGLSRRLMELDSGPENSDPGGTRGPQSVAGLQATSAATGGTTVAAKEMIEREAEHVRKIRRQVQTFEASRLRFLGLARRYREAARWAWLYRVNVNPVNPG